MIERPPNERPIGHDGVWIGMVEQPVFAGAYQVGDDNGLMIWYEERPPFYKRLLVEWLLGWRWVDVVFE